MGLKTSETLMSMSAHLSRVIVHDLTSGTRRHVQVLGPTATSKAAAPLWKSFQRFGPVQGSPANLWKYVTCTRDDGHG